MPAFLRKRSNKVKDIRQYVPKEINVPSFIVYWLFHNALRVDTCC